MGCHPVGVPDESSMHTIMPECWSSQVQRESDPEPLPDDLDPGKLIVLLAYHLTLFVLIVFSMHPLISAVNHKNQITQKHDIPIPLSLSMQR